MNVPAISPNPAPSDLPADPDLRAAVERAGYREQAGIPADVQDADGNLLDDETAIAGEVVPSSADVTLLGLWLHGRSPHTIRAYRRDLARFVAFVGKPLGAVTLGDLQAFADTLSGADSSRGRVLASVKSLLSFAAKLGAIPFNVGAALQKVRARDTLADRILSEADVSRMLIRSEGRDHIPNPPCIRWRAPRLGAGGPSVGRSRRCAGRVLVRDSLRQRRKDPHHSCLCGDGGRRARSTRRRAGERPRFSRPARPSEPLTGLADCAESGDSRGN